MSECRPWESLVTATALPWTASQTPFNRRVNVHRARTIGVTPSGADDIGLTGYSGLEQSTDPTNLQGEVVLYSGLQAAIELKSSGRSRGPLPADVVYKPEWIVYIPSQGQGSELYDIRDRDILVDDEGYRYAVSANQWTPTGYSLSTIRLEA